MSVTGVGGTAPGPDVLQPAVGADVDAADRGCARRRSRRVAQLEELLRGETEPPCVQPVGGAVEVLDERTFEARRGHAREHADGVELLGEVLGRRLPPDDPRDDSRATSRSRVAGHGLVGGVQPPEAALASTCVALADVDERRLAPRRATTSASSARARLRPAAARPRRRPAAPRAAAAGRAAATGRPVAGEARLQPDGVECGPGVGLEPGEVVAAVVGPRPARLRSPTAAGRRRAARAAGAGARRTAGSARVGVGGIGGVPEPGQQVAAGRQLQAEVDAARRGRSRRRRRG